MDYSFYLRRSKSLFDHFAKPPTRIHSAHQYGEDQDVRLEVDTAFLPEKILVLGERVCVDVSLKDNYDCNSSGHVPYLRVQKLRSSGRYSDAHTSTSKVLKSANYKADSSLRR